MAYIRKILIWIKCYVLNRHLYVRNNSGMSNDMFDDVDYYECTHCNNVKLEVNPRDKNYGDKMWYKKLLENAIRHKRAYNMKLERRKVLIEKTSQEIKDLEYYLGENNWIEV